MKRGECVRARCPCLYSPTNSLPLCVCECVCECMRSLCGSVCLCMWEWEGVCTPTQCGGGPERDKLRVVPSKWNVFFSPSMEPTPHSVRLKFTAVIHLFIHSTKFSLSPRWTWPAFLPLPQPQGPVSSLNNKSWARALTYQTPTYR